MKKGISVLIPVFDFDLQFNVAVVVNLLNNSKIDFEIRIYDDFSEEKYKNSNRRISNDNIVYKELPANIGRSAIRNKLAVEAVFDVLLFLDCDFEIVNEFYIANYLTYISSKNVVVSGGTLYKDTAPKNDTVLLHWKAGKYKEQKTALERSKNPYHSFTLNNLLISKEIYLSIRLDEKIKTYGHEDSKFGFELENMKIHLVHIDNSVYHIGLNSTDDFIKKSISAAENLAYLVKHEHIGVQTKLSSSYLFLKAFKLTGIYKLVFTFLKPLLYKNLKSKHPFLLFLDLVKLNAFISKISVK